MDEHELTPDEKRLVKLIETGSEKVKRIGLVKTLLIVIPSLGLMVVWWITQNPLFAFMGYCLLMYKCLHNYFNQTRLVDLLREVLRKYQKRIDDKNN